MTPETHRVLSTRNDAAIWLDRVDGRRMLCVVVEPINARGTTVVRLAGGTKNLRIAPSTVVAAQYSNIEHWSQFSEIAAMQERGEFLRHDRKGSVR